MDKFAEFLQSRNPQAAMAGAMAGPSGGSYGAMAMQTLQNAQRQAAIAAQPPAAMPNQQVPGGPSLPQAGPGAQGMAPGVMGAQGMAPQPMAQPPSDPEYEEGYRIGMLLKQALGIGG